jgi:serine protease Do
MSLLDELSESAAHVAARAGAAVARVGRDGGRGAATVIAEGVLLTSAHNLRGQEVTITFADGRSEVGRVTGVDVDDDIAVVAADTGTVEPIEWSPADGEVVGVGRVVFALGAPPSASGARVTVGTVSAAGVAFRGPRGRLISDAFEHTAPVGRGSSGGPVVDSAGRLVGVNTHRPGDGFYLAIPATSELKGKVDALGRGEVPSRRRLGVALTPPHVARRLRAAVGLPPQEGVLIREVAEDGPAASSGLQTGDLIVAAGAAEVTSIDGLLHAIDSLVGDTLTITVVRGTERLEIEVRFPAPPA